MIKEVDILLIFLILDKNLLTALENESDENDRDTTGDVYE